MLGRINSGGGLLMADLYFLLKGLDLFLQLKVNILIVGYQSGHAILLLLPESQLFLLEAKQLSLLLLG
jgi:hypothetical protein